MEDKRISKRSNSKMTRKVLLKDGGSLSAGAFAHYVDAAQPDQNMLAGLLANSESATFGNAQFQLTLVARAGLEVKLRHPLQPECMDPVEIKKKYGDRLVLHGAMSLQRTLPFGTPEDVEAEARYLIENCNVNGGFVLGPSNVMFKEILLENIVAMYRAVN